MGMSKFNSDDHIYYCGQESLRRNVALTVNKRVQNEVPGLYRGTKPKPSSIVDL